MKKAQSSSQDEKSDSREKKGNRRRRKRRQEGSAADPDAREKDLLLGEIQTIAVLWAGATCWPGETSLPVTCSPSTAGGNCGADIYWWTTWARERRNTI